MRPATYVDDGERTDGDDNAERTAGDECVDHGEQMAGGDDGEPTADSNEASSVCMCVSDGWIDE